MQKDNHPLRDLGRQIFHFSSRQLVLMIVGNLILGLGVAMFNFSAMGNHPFHSMLFAAEAKTAVSYAMLQIMLNVVLIVVEYLFGRRYIGFGTIVNMFLLGYAVTFFAWLLQQTGLSGLAVRIVFVVLGTICISFGISLYQTADMGVAPYDSMPIIVSERTKIPFFWCRIAEDGICFLVCLLLRGEFGVGTVITVFCTGPFIRFFDRTVSAKLIGSSAKTK